MKELQKARTSRVISAIITDQKRRRNSKVNDLSPLSVGLSPDNEITIIGTCHDLASMRTACD
jgi:hypothetical protein